MIPLGSTLELTSSTMHDARRRQDGIPWPWDDYWVKVRDVTPVAATCYGQITDYVLRPDYR